MRDDDGVFPDDVPVADAVEQRHSIADVPPDFLSGEDRQTAAPLESTSSDWQEQQEVVVIDPELEEPEQRE